LYLDQISLLRFVSPHKLKHDTNTHSVQSHIPPLRITANLLILVGLVLTYRGSDKSLACPGRKQATVTANFEFHISYLQS